MPDTALMNGFELVTGLSKGIFHRPPMADLLPFTLLPPGDGHVELLAKPEARFLNMMNTVHGGWIMTMLDTSMSLAAQTMLKPGEVCPSQETSVYIRFLPTAAK
ncbi:PaaI family thioesterase [Rhizobium sp. BR 362]|uniref:PaaI family thioesterase n=1 Tax=Rhizobium sp. BR 362 TaxID=3040670 RepID=UPI002F3ED973